MAITKLISPTTPNPVSVGDGGDWDLAMAQLTAMKIVLGGQQMILTEWTNATSMPALSKGSYIFHKGAIYVVDTSDYALSTSIDGWQYLRVRESGETLALDFVSSVAGYNWSGDFSGMYNGEYQLLPYKFNINAGGGLYEKYKILNLMQGSGFVTVDYLGAITGSGPIVATSLDTGHGANQLYPMNQPLLNTSSPTFNNVTINDILLRYSGMTQGSTAVLMSYSTSFGNVQNNKPVTKTSPVYTLGWDDILNSIDVNNDLSTLSIYVKLGKSTIYAATLSAVVTVNGSVLASPSLPHGLTEETTLAGTVNITRPATFTLQITGTANQTEYSSNSGFSLDVYLKVNRGFSVLEALYNRGPANIAF